MTLLLKVFQDYNKLLFRIVYAIIPKTEDVEDILQETFVKALLSNKNDMTEEETIKWLITIARNTSFSFLRKNKPTELLDDYMDTLTTSDWSLGNLFLIDLNSLNTKVPIELIKYFILNIKYEVSLLEISRKTTVSYERLRYRKKIFIEDFITWYFE